MSNRWFRRLLAACPALIAVLWVAGVAHFRNVELTPVEWLTVAAAAFALQTLARRLARPRPLPPLPAGSNPVTLAALAAAILAVPAALLAGLLELYVDSLRPSATSWALRTIWHTACVFALGYCTFLLRLGAAPAGSGRGQPPTPA
jgi:hypothetical protein